MYFFIKLNGISVGYISLRNLPRGVMVVLFLILGQNSDSTFLLLSSLIHMHY